MSVFNCAVDCCLSKAFLQSLCLNISGVDLYADYFERYLLFDEDTNISALSRFPNSRELLRKKHYRDEHPYAQPPHFNFFSHHDINRLAAYCNKRVVIYYHHHVSKEGPLPNQTSEEFWHKKRLQPFHDFRVVLSNGKWTEVDYLDDDDDDDDDIDDNDDDEDNGDDDESEEIHQVYYPEAKNENCKQKKRGQQRRWQTVFFVLTSSGGLYRFPDGSFGLDNWLRKKSAFFLPPNGLYTSLELNKPGDEYDTGFSNLLNMCDFILRGSDGDDPLQAEEENDEFAQSFMTGSDFVNANRFHLAERWQEVTNTSVILVTFVRLAGRSVANPRLLMTAKKTKFITLAVVPQFSECFESSRNPMVDHPDLVKKNSRVICIYGDCIVGELSEPFRSAVVEKHQKTAGEKERLSNRAEMHPGVEKRLPTAFVEEAKLAKKQKKFKRAGDSYIKRCTCDLCRSPEYENNMAKSGPERLCTTPYTIRELLQLLGQLDTDMNLLIEKMCDLSVASMDIESRTMPLSMGGPRPGPKVVYPEVSTPILEGHSQKMQKPIMIAHTDAGTIDLQGAERWCETAADDSEHAIFVMFERYWDFVEKRRIAATEQKMALAQPLIDLVNRYKQAYQEYAQRWSEASHLERSQLVHQASQQAERSARESGLDLSEEDVVTMKESAVDQIMRSEDWDIPDVKTLNKAFKGLLPGQLEDRVRRLVDRYVVFSFYGYTFKQLLLLFLFLYILN